MAGAAPTVMRLVWPAVRAWGAGKVTVRPRKPADEKCAGACAWLLGATVALLRPAQAVCGLLEMACWHWYWPCQVAPHAPCPWLLPFPCPRRVAQPLACARGCRAASRHGTVCATVASQPHRFCAAVAPGTLARTGRACQRRLAAPALPRPRLQRPICVAPFATSYLQCRICTDAFRANPTCIFKGNEKEPPCKT